MTAEPLRLLPPAHGKQEGRKRTWEMEARCLRKGSSLILNECHQLINRISKEWMNAGSMIHRVGSVRTRLFSCIADRMSYCVSSRKIIFTWKRGHATVTVPAQKSLFN